MELRYELSNGTFENWAAATTMHIGAKGVSDLGSRVPGLGILPSPPHAGESYGKENGTCNGNWG